MGVSSLFSHKPHVVVHDFTEFGINAKHFTLFEGKSKKPRLFCGPAKNLRGPAVENHWSSHHFIGQPLLPASHFEAIVNNICSLP